MEIKINDEAVSVLEDSTVADIAKKNSLPEKGVAIAVNEEMIPRTDWLNTKLKSGDKVIIIRAVCGG